MSTHWRSFSLATDLYPCAPSPWISICLYLNFLHQSFTMLSFIKFTLMSKLIFMIRVDKNTSLLLVKTSFSELTKWLEWQRFTISELRAEWLSPFSKTEDRSRRTTLTQRFKMLCRPISTHWQQPSIKRGTEKPIHTYDKYLKLHSDYVEKQLWLF